MKNQDFHLQNDLTLRLMRVTWSYFVWQQPELSIKEKTKLNSLEKIISRVTLTQSGRFVSETLAYIASDWDLPLVSPYMKSQLQQCFRGKSINSRPIVTRKICFLEIIIYFSLIRQFRQLPHKLWSRNSHQSRSNTILKIKITIFHGFPLNVTQIKENWVPKKKHDYIKLQQQGDNYLETQIIK